MSGLHDTLSYNF